MLLFQSFEVLEAGELGHPAGMLGGWENPTKMLASYGAMSWQVAPGIWGTTKSAQSGCFERPARTL